MRLDELVDQLVQPQQDQEVRIEIKGRLFDLILTPAHESGFFVLKAKEDK